MTDATTAAAADEEEEDDDDDDDDEDTETASAAASSSSSSKGKQAPPPPQQVAGLSKAKAKKAARKANGVVKGGPGAKEAVPEMTCSKCGQRFESRTKLFKHLEQTGHAALKR